MILSHSDYKKIKKYDYGRFAMWVATLGKDFLEEGRRQGREEATKISAEQLQEAVKSDTDLRESFSIWEYDDLYARLSKDFAKVNVEKIMRIIGGENG